MSRIGNQPITVSTAVQLEITDGTVFVKGPKGEMSVMVPQDITVTFADGQVKVERANNLSHTRALHGLAQRLVHNAVTGVEKLWEKKLEVIGTGYRVKLQGKDLVFEVGYSHPVKFEHVDGLEYVVQQNIVTISGADRQLVGQIANKIKAIKKPDPYKGKGIRYVGEIVKLKPGKKAKTA